jgi:ribosomal protein S18 acetylase RimI-like enzyme
MPAVRLVAMTEEQYLAYRSTSDEGYAQDIASSGSMSLEDARAKSAADFARLLPDGLATENERFWTAYDAETDAEVAMLWVHYEMRSDGMAAFGYDFRVHEQLRRSGYGRAIMTAAEAVLREQGVVSIGLNVFGDNLGARSLYEQMGFETTSIQMRKRLI